VEVRSRKIFEQGDVLRNRCADDADLLAPSRRCRGRQSERSHRHRPVIRLCDKLSARLTQSQHSTSTGHFTHRILTSPCPRTLISSTQPPQSTDAVDVTVPGWMVQFVAKEGSLKMVVVQFRMGPPGLREEAMLQWRLVSALV